MTDFEPQATTAPTCFRHPQRETYIRCQRCDRPICPDCMTPAAVGFQCPECVAAGRAEAGVERARFGGRRSANPQLTTGVLIAINLAVWILIVATGGIASPWLTRLALKLGGYCLVEPRLTEQVCDQVSPGSWSDGVFNGAWWLPLTSTFTHVEVLHIGFNMFALFVLGPQLEALVGRARFLTIYLLSGIGGSVAVLWLASPYGTTVGASGSLFGLMAALLIVVYRLGGDARNILFWLGLNVVLTFSQSGISWQGHLGGFVVGALVTGVIAYAPRSWAGLSRTQLQIVGCALVAILLVALTMLRVATWG